MGKMVEVKQFSNNKLPIPDEQFNRHWHTKKKKKPSKNTSKHQMRKPLVQYMYVTLVIINTVGQCLMILKPKGGWGGGVHNGVWKSRVINMAYPSHGWMAGLRQRCKICSNKKDAQTLLTYFCLKEPHLLRRSDTYCIRKHKRESQGILHFQEDKELSQTTSLIKLCHDLLPNT